MEAPGQLPSLPHPHPRKSGPDTDTLLFRTRWGTNRLPDTSIAVAIYTLGHGLCTFTAVLRSTQPSTLSGTVK